MKFNQYSAIAVTMLLFAISVPTKCDIIRRELVEEAGPHVYAKCPNNTIWDTKKCELKNIFDTFNLLISPFSATYYNGSIDVIADYDKNKFVSKIFTAFLAFVPCSISDFSGIILRTVELIPYLGTWLDNLMKNLKNPDSMGTPGSVTNSILCGVIVPLCYTQLKELCSQSQNYLTSLSSSLSCIDSIPRNDTTFFEYVKFYSIFALINGDVGFVTVTTLFQSLSNGQMTFHFTSFCIGNAPNYNNNHLYYNFPRRNYTFKEIFDIIVNKTKTT